MKTMKTTKKLCSVVTAFVMAFTVFGCTGLTFAAEEEPEAEPMAASEPAEPEDAGDAGVEGAGNAADA